MKTLFVTGAEGFTGRHLVEYLQRRGYEVVGGVRNRGRKLAYERQYGKALVCDVGDAINVARAIASVQPEGVIHLAGMSQPNAATDEPLIAYQSIVTAWANILDAVRRTVPRARVLLASSCDVYGWSGSPQQLREDSTLNPVNTFGALKATAETLAQTFHENYQTNVTIVRPFHYTGPGQSENFFFGAVAKQLAEWDTAIHGSELKLPDLSFKRDLLHVADVVEAYSYLLEEGRPSEVYNLCSGQTWTVRDVVEMMIRRAGLHLQLADLPTDAEKQVPCYWGDNTKLATAFEWHPSHTLEQAVADLIRGYQAAPATSRS